MISVVIPTLNSEEKLARTLAPLVHAAAQGLVKQVVIADGGSTDATPEIAEAAGCDFVSSATGRGKQLRAGAQAAKGRWLLFLHADTVLGWDWSEEIERFISAPEARLRAAAFRLAFDDDCPAARRVLFWARLRASMLKLPYGDQGLFISRFLYDALGGFSDIPLMEDVDIVRRIGARRLSILRTEAVTSADKYRRDGYERRAWRNLFLIARYLAGADVRELARSYD
jgi:rSAM/selenodomain-associated transferase 2